jgi:phosphoribosyl 1,2-cyclic phosphate phosphodiesterase
MKVTVIGSGTSTGVPQIGCRCAVCASNDPHDKRLRCSSLLEIGDVRILIDCGPDFREQMMNLPFGRIDAVLITHEHYDHVAGLDDLRPFCQLAPVPIYSDHRTAEALRQRMPYCLKTDHPYPGVPSLSLHEVEPFYPFRVKDVEILPFRVMHGFLPILGFRIERFGYITDMLTMPDNSFRALQGLDTLFMNALRVKPHNTHQSLSEALVSADRIKSSETYFIHMSHEIGLHKEVELTLPPQVHLAYDGLVLNI